MQLRTARYGKCCAWAGRPQKATKIGVPREPRRYALPVEKRRGRPDTGTVESVKVFDPEPRKAMNAQPLEKV